MDEAQQTTPGSSNSVGQPAAQPQEPAVQVNPDALKDIESEIKRLESQNFNGAEQATAMADELQLPEIPSEPTAAVSGSSIQPELATPLAQEPVASSIPPDVSTAGSDTTPIPNLEPSTSTTPPQDTPVIEPVAIVNDVVAAPTPEPTVVAAEPTQQSIVAASTPVDAPVEMKLAQPPDEVHIAPETPAAQPITESVQSEAQQSAAPTESAVPTTGSIVAPTTESVPVADENAPLNAITGEPEKVQPTEVTSDSTSAQPSTPKALKTPGRKSKFMLFFVVGVLLALMIAIALAAYFLQPKKVTPAETSVDLVSRSVMASSVDDLGQACGGTLISNAAAYSATDTNMHPIVLFEEQSSGAYTRSTRAFKDGGLSVTTPAQVQLVGCIKRDTTFAGSLVKSCPLSDANKVTVNVDYLTARYVVDIFASKTGDKVGSTTVSSTTTTCPETATFTTPDPKVYAQAETGDIEAALVVFAAAHK